ncbi:inactivation-no-after-potential D protein [Hermetia illucens]|uniref:inactivation-no-after-potential D protein n=1 Tax=Hermetia illucens TaxID=343691 RepID=UPI0018CBF4E8|nr:inactivation-no-after-potential D protein [Hermetia illucens]
MTVIPAEGETKEVVIEKGPKESFGICIVRGEVKGSKLTGIFIKDIISGTPAHRCGDLKVGDRILSINDNDVRHATEQVFISFIKDAGLKINLKIERIDQPTTKTSNDSAPTENGFAFTNGETPTNNSSAAPGSDESDDEDTRDMTGRTMSAAGYEIDRASAGNVKFSNAEKAADTEQEDEFGYTAKKIRKRYGALGKVIRTHAMRPPNTDLGIALAGHKDRKKMACLIAGVNPNGIAKGADLKPGDEVLEVNGYVLQERCHLNASGVFKKLTTEKIVFIVLRREPKNNVLAVPPVTHFPPEIDETENLFQTYKNCKAVQVQKAGSSLGIMIIEGKHAEVGAGIFISDIQAGSNAELAGLRVGDMILAVNKDVVVDSKYDDVAALLKRAQGVVNLVICCLKTEEEIKKEEEKKKQEEEEKRKKREREEEERKKPVDPATAVIEPNKKTLIEIKPEKKPLGCMVVGGKNNYVTTGCVITNIYADGVFANDKRLQVFDQILDLNGDPVKASEMTTLKVYQLFHLPYEKLTLTVWRNDPPEIETLSIDVNKKSGKDLGLALVENPKGVMISEIISAGCADIEGKMQRGDIISKINGESLENTPLAISNAFFRQATGKINFEVIRPKPTARN